MLTVTFSGEAYETLRDLMRDTGRSADDLLGEALALEQKAIEIMRDGGRLLVERQGRQHELLIGLREALVEERAAYLYHRYDARSPAWDELRASDGVQSLYRAQARAELAAEGLLPPQP